MITKMYINPITGDEQDSPFDMAKKDTEMSLPEAITFRDEDKPFIILELSPDYDISSATINIVINWNEKQLNSQMYKQMLHRLATCVRDLIEAKLPSKMESHVEEAEPAGSIYINIPDFSGVPVFNADMLCELIVKRLCEILMECPKCHSVIDGISPKCPICREKL